MTHPVSPSTTAAAPPTSPRLLPWGLLVATGVLWVAGAWAVVRLDVPEISDLAMLVSVVLAGSAVSHLVQTVIMPGQRLAHGLLCAVAVALGWLLVAAPSGTPGWLAALVGGYLMIMGTVAVAIALGTREGNAARGIGLLVGVGQLLLGFAASTRLVDSAYLLVLVVGGLALLHGLGDLTATARIREINRVRRPAADGTAASGAADGYAAGRADFAAARRVSTAGAGRHSAAENDEPALPQPSAGVPALAGARASAAGLAADGSAVRLPSTAGPAADGGAVRLPSTAGPAADGSAGRLPSTAGPAADGSAVRLPTGGPARTGVGNPTLAGSLVPGSSRSGADGPA